MSKLQRSCRSNRAYHESTILRRLLLAGQPVGVGRLPASPNEQRCSGAQQDAHKDNQPRLEGALDLLGQLAALIDVECAHVVTVRVEARALTRRRVRGNGRIAVEGLRLFGRALGLDHKCVRHVGAGRDVLPCRLERPHVRSKGVSLSQQTSDDDTKVKPSNERLTRNPFSFSSTSTAALVPTLNSWKLTVTSRLEDASAQRKRRKKKGGTACSPHVHGILCEMGALTRPHNHEASPGLRTRVPSPV